MADEKIVPTPAEEVKDGKPAEVAPAEPKEPRANEPAAEAAAPEERYEEAEPDRKDPESVPLHVHIQAKEKYKNEIRELREQLKGANPSAAKISQIAEKWGVDAADVQALAEAIKGDSNREVEAKLSAIEQDRRQAKVDAAFDEEFQKLSKSYPQLEGKKRQLKQLAFTRDYLKSPLEQIAQDVFGDFLQKGTLEPSRPSGEGASETLDFSKPLTAEAWDRIKSDPKAKQAYFDYMNSQ